MKKIITRAPNRSTRSTNGQVFALPSLYRASASSIQDRAAPGIRPPNLSKTEHFFHSDELEVMNTLTPLLNLNRNRIRTLPLTADVFFQEVSHHVSRQRTTLLGNIIVVGLGSPMSQMSQDIPSRGEAIFSPAKYLTNLNKP